MRRIPILTALFVVATTATTIAAPLAIVDGTVHPVNGDPFSGHVLVEDGLIVAAGPDIAIPEDAKVIDASGLGVYPGFMDAMGQVGLLEVSSVTATDDRAEMGAYNPHLEAATAIHPDSDLIGVARSTGLTHALVAPRAARDGVLAGRATLVDLAGWTVEEMAVRNSAALVINWPPIRTRSFDFATFSFKESPFEEAQKKAKEQQNELRDWFDAAAHYAKAMKVGSPRAEKDRKLAHLAAFLDRGGKVILQASSKRDIEAAIAFAEERNLDMILAGGRDAWMVAETLAEKKIPVLLGAVQSLPNQEDDPYDRPFDAPAQLVEAGVKIAFGSGAGGGFGGSPHGARLLPYQAAMAVAYGLDAEAAMKALTIWPAEIFGVEAELGSIEVGKRANLAIVEGDPLSLRSQTRALVIGGNEVSPRDFHQELYERYRERPSARQTLPRSSP